MNEKEMLEDCVHLIVNCGSALELAEFARKVEIIGQYHEINNWQSFYDELYSKIITYAAIPDEYYVGTDILQKAIRIS